MQDSWRCVAKHTTPCRKYCVRGEEVIVKEDGNDGENGATGETMDMEALAKVVQSAIEKALEPINTELGELKKKAEEVKQPNFLM